MTPIALDGTVRARTPEETWLILIGQMARLGITRVARITGLDYLDIPVWTAIRPSAHTLVTSQGKGATDLLAKISAVLESAELWHAEQPLPVAARGTHRDLGIPYPMSALPVKLDHDSLPDIPLDWALGTGLTSGRSVLVPADLVRRHLRRDVVAPNVFHVTSNGLACGNTASEATVHALCEVIERDVLHRDYASGGAHRTLINPGSVEDRYCRDLIDRFLDARMFLEIALVDSAYEIPVCAVYIWSEDYPILFAGSGCHRDPHIALSRALTEAAQSRLTCIVGTRDDLESHEHAFSARPPRPEHAGPNTGEWATVTTRYGPTERDFQAETAAVAARVASVTGYEPVAIDLCQSDAYAAVKVAAPGLEMRITRSIPRPGKRHG
ncbi:YcaO-like family protein [Streptomyces halobius]|uniref:YcaO-like family protein n=1 Tax=Streptomyces halobius TaxID=2879846 RepID=A0ABY4MIT7_9ACTN|nr:YcaO-like family protein [Streptomyces halobius]UQA97473.1 YcaO-like family protein [Streptomyces halobius]